MSEQQTVAAVHPVTTIDLLRSQAPRSSWWAWLVTVGITALAFFLRVWEVHKPNSLLFDETYYPKDAWTLLHLGYEGKWQDDVNDKIVTGQVDLYSKDPAFIVHPPLGKWLIAAGESLFGMNSFGWRISAVIFGALLVFFTILLAWQLSKSILIGALAGVFLTFDGLAFVMSRLGLLDGFQATFLLAAATFVVMDRHWFRERLGRYLEHNGLTNLGGRLGPLLWWRPFRLAAGLMMGCSVAVKWNSLFFIAVICVLGLWWDISARRVAGAGKQRWWGLVSDGIPAFIYQVVTTGLIYVVSWVRWFATSGGYDRTWGIKHPNDGLVKLVGPDIASWLKYHDAISGFHNGDYMMKEASHPYEAHPAGWLFMVRPIGIDAQNDIKPGEDGCPATTADTCIRVISAMGTPLLWWAGAIALIAGILWWIFGRDWRFGLPVLGLLSTYVPWFFFADRPLFFFYAITIIPFTCAILAMAVGKVMGGPAQKGRRQAGAILGGVLTALIVANFAFIYPILTDELLRRSDWSLRMWLNSWI